MSRGRLPWIAGAALLAAIASSTPEGRAEARARLAEFNPLLRIVAILICGALIWGWISR